MSKETNSDIFNPHRYQLSKHGTCAIKEGHPWIFRSNLSSAVEIFKSGQQLSLVDGGNKPRGFGIFDPHGRIGIRVYSQESDQPLSEDLFTKKILKAYQKRLVLKLRTNAYRVIHGEADRLPGITLDVYNGHGILQLYSSSLLPWLDVLRTSFEKTLPLSSLTLHQPRRSQGRDFEDKILTGTRPDIVEINESEDRFLVSLTQGQKGGMFLDLRPVRNAIRKNIHGKKMLNLFCHSGTASLVAIKAGFTSTVNIDLDDNALSLAKSMLGETGNEFIACDLFKSFPKELKGEFDFILIDPPSLGARHSQLPVIQHGYQKLIKNSLPLLSENGTLIICSCTRVVTKKHLKLWVENEASYSGIRLKFQNEILAAEDHPVINSFPEGNYWSSVRFIKT